MKQASSGSIAGLSNALSEWQSAVGKEWVFTSTDDVDLYRDGYSPSWGETDERRASAAVAPGTVEEVQQVVRIANRHKVPLYTISTGRNLTYGGSAPVQSGNVILDLKRMNRILEVDEINASVLVEPGVSYFDLYRHIRSNKLQLWVDVPDPGWGSLVGNSLDHGCGYTATPYRDHFDAHCGMEVVLASGDLIRTGMGALPGAKTWQQFKYGMGPLVDGLFAQSNFGVVTKMGFWLMPEPEAALRATVTVPRYKDGAALADTLIALIYADILRGQTQLVSPILHGPPDAALAGLLGRWDSGRYEALDSYATSHGIPFWTAPLVFYGPEPVIRAQWEYAKKRLGPIPGAQFKEDAWLTFPLADEDISRVVEQSRFGIPNLSYFASRRAPNAPPLEGHIDFSPVIPMRGETMLQALDVFGKVFAEMGVVPLGGLPLFYHTRTLTIIYALPTGRDPATNKRARDAFSRLMEVGAAHGWGEYRIHAMFMDKAVGFYNFNQGALLRFHESLKDAVDPNGILSPGRYGVWPKHLRGATK